MQESDMIQDISLEDDPRIAAIGTLEAVWTMINDAPTDIESVEVFREYIQLEVDMMIGKQYASFDE